MYMDYIYSICLFQRQFFDVLKNHSRIGHFFKNLNEKCYNAMMHTIFVDMYSSENIDHDLVKIHKKLLLCDQDFSDWLDCFNQTCKSSGLVDVDFIRKIKSLLHKLRERIIVENQFDIVLTLEMQHLPIKNELIALHELTHRRKSFDD